VAANSNHVVESGGSDPTGEDSSEGERLGFALMTRGLWPDPVDEKVAASDPAGEEDSSGGPASDERLHVDEANKARIPFLSSCLPASACRRPRR
jgi:hypothetical protein